MSDLNLHDALAKMEEIHALCMQEVERAKEHPTKSKLLMPSKAAALHSFMLCIDLTAAIFDDTGVITPRPEQKPSFSDLDDEGVVHLLTKFRDDLKDIEEPLRAVLRRHPAPDSKDDEPPETSLDSLALLGDFLRMMQVVYIAIVAGYDSTLLDNAFENKAQTGIGERSYL